ncbi:LUD domain-containing protein [Candidatus Daviesbacteria bacterium]|nr:LUD domain-containing protein [Candidatus Daviesbacteria bacterium]
MDKWNTLADQQTIDRTIQALNSNGINAKFVQTGEQAKEVVLEMIPQGAEVFTQTSITLETIEILADLNQSGRYDSVRKKLNHMNRETQNSMMQKLGAGPDWTIGSVHAVTEDGYIFIASNTGSQLSAYSGGAIYVIWIVGAQKIVKDNDEALKRIYEYVLPLESERANKAYNITTGSNVSKLLIVNKEVKPGRISLILVGEKLGF